MDFFTSYVWKTLKDCINFPLLFFHKKDAIIRYYAIGKQEPRKRNLKRIVLSDFERKKDEYMYFLIGADLVPTKSNTELFVKGDVKELLGEELKDIMDKASYRIFNLEVPLTDEEMPIMKCGPNLRAKTETIEGYKALDVNLLTLANNHILDQDVQGLKSTINTLDGAEIDHVGAGDDVASAAKPYVFDFNNKKIGIYACAEHEFSIVTENSPGANPFDPLWSLDHVVELKKSVDYVIVLYHGGKEHYRYPSPMLQNNCRRLIDKGADLVLCQHSHCIGCKEDYLGGTIVYGQGNFLFDHSNNECWQTSLLVKVGDNMDVSYLPLIKAGNGVRLASGHEAKEILEGFYNRSEEITKCGFIEERYKAFAKSYLDFYLSAINGNESILVRLLNKLTFGSYMRKILKRRYNQGNKIRIANYLDCEAHRELFSTAISDEYKNANVKS